MQDKLAELCAKNIPESYTLYVKAHPHGKGAIPVQWLKRMSLIPNVKLIAPDLNAHDLIINSQCIITVNSDVGWEALLYFKPVVVLAKPFYSGCGVTFDVNNMEELSIKIEEALDIKEIEPEKVYRLVNAVMNSLYEGAFHKKDSPQLNHDVRNIKKVVDSILKKYEEISGI
jgi:capsule polysaccharide export protein KpsC/LpsZ